jgi:tetratricopeptide (TPR) repeat protein
MANKKIVLVGYNEDFLELRTKIWFLAAEKGAHGCMIWGFDRAIYPYQGGVNDRGLFVDLNALTIPSGWKADPKKADLNTDMDLIEYIVKNIATVDEAIDFFEKYNIDLNYIMITIADAKGKSVIFEWANGQLQIIQKEQSYQICTNDLLAPTGIPFSHSDRRWVIADNILRNQTTPSVDLMRRVLSATCAQFDFTTTLYSTICDLVNNKVYLYHFHNYEEVVVFDLKKELAKGERSYSIPDLFQVHPYSSDIHKDVGRQLGDVALQRIIDERGIKEGIQAFQGLKDRKRTYSRYLFQEWIIRNAALEYLNKNRLAEAIELFKLNVQEYPGSSEVYVDLADAYVKQNNIPFAIQQYEKALERDPHNEKVKGILKSLKK